MRLYIGNPKDAIKKLLELVNEFSKVTKFKINIQKSVAFTNNELWEREIKTIPLKAASKRIKYLGINLTKEVKDLYSEHYDVYETNWRQHKQMERYTTFMDYKNQYS